MQIMRNMPLSTGAITNGSQHVCRHEGEGDMGGEADDLIYLYLWPKSSLKKKRELKKAHKTSLQQPRVLCLWGDARMAVTAGADFGFPGGFTSQGTIATPSHLYLGCSRAIAGPPLVSSGGAEGGGRGRNMIRWRRKLNPAQVLWLIS